MFLSRTQDEDKSSYLTDDAAQWLVKLKARIDGYDFLEDPIVKELNRTGEEPSEAFTIHLILLRDGVLRLEYVNNLSQIKVPRYQVFVLPINFRTLMVHHAEKLLWFRH